MFSWRIKPFWPFSNLSKMIKRRRTYRRKRAPIFKMLPNEGIEQVIKVKSEKQVRKEKKKMRIYLGITVVSVFTMVLLLGSFFILELKDSGTTRWKWLNEFLGTEASFYDSSNSENSETSEPVSDDSFLLTVVNSSNKLPDDYKTEIVKYGDVEISAKIKDNLDSMRKAANAQGISLKISSGYISLEQQEKIYKSMYERYISLGYSAAKAENEISAFKSGYCEQNTGLSVQFEGADDFVNTSAYHWLSEHSVEYGFVLRYPENKKSKTSVAFQADLYRFVGEENALNMRKLGMCLEEYAQYISLR